MRPAAAQPAPRTAVAASAWRGAPARAAAAAPRSAMSTAIDHSERGKMHKGKKQARLALHKEHAGKKAGRGGPPALRPAPDLAAAPAANAAAAAAAPASRGASARAAAAAARSAMSTAIDHGEREKTCKGEKQARPAHPKQRMQGRRQAAAAAHLLRGLLLHGLRRVQLLLLMMGQHGGGHRRALRRSRHEALCPQPRREVKERRCTRNERGDAGSSQPA